VLAAAPVLFFGGPRVECTNAEDVGVVTVLASVVMERSFYSATLVCMSMCADIHTACIAILLALTSVLLWHAHV
jgi:hypothetical protein